MCLQCSRPIDYKRKTTNKFCNQSCSATYTNLKRPPKSIETRKKISIANKNRIITRESKIKYKKETIQRSEQNRNAYYNDPKTCKICNTVNSYEKRHRKTCSRECQTIASTSRTYQNGSKKYFYYKGIALESSWELEVAILLDSLNIKWIRPKPMQYLDQENKSRMYYPDFYLTDYNIFLDPKNEYCMRRDAYKMQQIENQITIVYGNLTIIKEFINLLGVA